MTNNGRFVFDTTVLVSAALISPSTPRQALESALTDGRILTSTDALVELVEVLHRSKFDRYLSDERRREFLAVYIGRAELVPITDSVVACRDPKDDKFLELAVCGRADAVVSSDGDLLALNPFLGIAIMTPADFLDNVRQRTSKG